MATLLVEFLTARLDEDETVARAAYPGPWALTGHPDEPRESWVVSAPTGINVAFGWRRDTNHIARHDPDRVLREVEAKRAIVYLTQHGCGDDYERVQRQLASAYADHPDYHEEWRL